MGAADIIPGVSGGTMALIVGIYSRLIESLSEVFSTLVAFMKARPRQAIIHLRNVDWLLLLPLGAGIATSLLIGARLIPELLEKYPHECLGLFFGLVAGSIAIPWKAIDHKGLSQIVLAISAAVLAFYLTGFPPGEGFTPSLLQVFGAAAVAICAMILPGISGAFLLKAMGMYEVTLMAVNARDLIYVGVFALGAIFGLGFFSEFLNWLLKHHYSTTMAALVGLMAGALRALWPWQEADRTLHIPAPGEPVAIVIVLAVVGFILVSLLALFGDRMERASLLKRDRDHLGGGSAGRPN
jgi:putative membrane protein